MLSIRPDAELAEATRLFYALQRRRRRKIAIIIAACLLVPLGGFVALRVMVAWRLEAELQSLRDAGFPRDWNEWEAFHPPPAEGNGAHAFLAAIAQIRKPASYERTDAEGVTQAVEPWNEIETVVGDSTALLTDDLRTRMDQLLADNSAALAALHHAASQRVGSRYPIDYGRGYWRVRHPPLSQIIDASALLGAEAIRSGERGDSAASVRAVQAQLALADSLRLEPLVMSQLVRVACIHRAVEAVERVVNIAPLDDAALAELIAALSNAEAGEAMQRGLAGVLAGCNGVYSSNEIGSMLGLGPPPLKVMLIGLYRASGVMDLDQLRSLRIMRRYLDAYELPMHQRVAAAPDHNQEGLLLIGRQITPSYGRVVVLDLRGITRNRAARIALAVERYRLARGELPASLEGLAPAFIDVLPDDPFTGSPMLYKPSEPGYTIYGLGEDGAAQGGTRRNDKDERYEPGSDIPFTVAR